MSRRMPKRPEKLDFFLALAETGVAVDDDVEARRRVQERRRAALNHARPCITELDYADVVRGTLKLTPALRAAKTWARCVVRPEADAAPAAQFLVLIGDGGLGKTVAAAAVIADELARFTTGPDLSSLQVQAARGDRRAAEEIVQIHAAGLLVLDDLCRDTCPPKEEHDAVFNLVHARQRPGYHTLITTNFGMGDLRRRLGDFVADRLENAGLVVKLTGPNLRRTSDPEPPGPRLVRQ